MFLGWWWSAEYSRYTKQFMTFHTDIYKYENILECVCVCILYIYIYMTTLTSRCLKIMIMMI